MISRTAGPTSFLTIKSSANFDRADVSEIGSYMLGDYIETGFVLDSGVILAYFHDAGSACSSNELFKMLQTGFAGNSVYSLSSQLCTSSGPHALRGFNVSDLKYTQNKHQALLLRIFRRMEEDRQLVGMFAWIRGERC